MKIAAATIAATVALSACTFGRTSLPSVSGGAAPSVTIRSTLQNHAIIGFSVDTPARAATAANQGITATILYDGAPSQKSALAKALNAHGISVVDASISDTLFYWECHRTHTVKPPPSSYGYNPYCKTDEDPKINSQRIALRHVAALLARDAKLPYVVGHWVLDDWPGWDPGSAHELLQKVHALIVKEAPGLPAICGFGAGVARPGKIAWDPGTAANYSNNGCDTVGWYNYSPFGHRRPSNGKRLDWTMKALLPAMQKSLGKRGWQLTRTPLYGIGQAWGGSYEKKFYQPGLTRGEMLDQARAFCEFGATYIGWYAWDDGGYDSRTQTPNNSATISSGIAAGLAACAKVWR
jgi:hypothetical protein